MKKISLKNFMVALYCLLMANGLSSQIVIDFESPATSTVFNGFGGAYVNIIPNPDQSGINTSATVGEYNETPGSQGFAGAFSNPITLPAIDFATYSTVCVKVWAPNTGDMLFKAEGQSAGATWEQLQPINVANTWVELCFDGTQTDAAGSGQNAIGRTFTVATVFFDFNPPVPPAVLTTWYFDDINMQGLIPVIPTSNFCETQVTHFGGDPGSVINLTITNVDANTMKVEIESANADPVDLLLVNNGSGATISPEDFSVPGKISRTLTWAVPPTDVNLNVLWSKASFGGNWQLSQADITVPFAAACPPGAPVSNYCETQVTHFGGDPGSVIKLTIANIDATTMYVEIESADADPVDFLLVANGSGATISAPNVAVPGKISRTLTWAVAPTDVTLNVLWSKASFGGNWQLSQADITVPFAATCALAPPPAPVNPTYCQAIVNHLGIPTEVASQIYLTITKISATSMKVEIESTNADPVDFLLIANGSGAAISPENTSVPGKISRTLTWANPPADVMLNVLWSKASFGGNWQLNQSDVTVSFDTVCGTAIPTMGEWAMFLFALIMVTMGVVFVMGMQTEVNLATDNGNVPVKFRRFPFSKENYLISMKHAIGLGIVGFAFIFIVWGEVVFADLVGMGLAVPIVAYLIHVFKK